MWFKYRYKFSHGPTHWHFIEAANAQELESLTDSHNGEHYRGIEYVKVKGLPENIIKEKLEQANMKLTGLKKYIESLSKLKPCKVVPKCSKCGWKFYCKNPLLKRNIKLNDPECVKHFIRSEKMD